MSGSSARLRSWGLLPLLVLLLLSAPIQAQVPEIGESQTHYAVNLEPSNGTVMIPFRGNAIVPVIVDDVSTGATEEPLIRERGEISLTVDILANNTHGWAASLDRTLLQSIPGQTHEIKLNIEPGITIEDPEVEVQIQAVYDPPAGEEHVTNVSILAVVESFPRLQMITTDWPSDFEPGQMQQVGIRVTNDNLYPDMVSLRIDQPEGWMVSPPSSIRLDPGESKVVYIDIRAPSNPWFHYTPKNEYIPVEIVSGSTDRQMMTSGVPVKMQGSDLPAWAVPHLLMLALGGALLVKRKARKTRDRRLEKGKPSYPGLEPEHEAEFEALKIEDPDEADDLKGRLETLYDERKRAWKQARKERQEDEEHLKDIYQERHEALVASREGEERPDRDQLGKRRRLLEKKRALLEQKRQRLQSEGASTDESAQDPEAGPA